jgi:hypothetical protein
MGERPHGYELDRKDNHKGYEPGNCHWTTKTKQQANRKTWKISKSGYRGVEVRGKRFVAKVGQREPYRYVAGYFANAAEAAWMRDQWAMAIYGDSAVLNFEYL